MIAPRVLVACTLVGLACSEPPDPIGPEITSKVSRLVFPWHSQRKIDILFVVDNSPAMTPHRARVESNYATMMQWLEAMRGGIPDVQIGVVTSDLADEARFQTHGAPVDGLFLLDIGQLDGTRHRNYTGALSTAFTQMASAGDQGSTSQHPLEAMRRALTNPDTGFLRQGAGLMVVFVQAGDDAMPEQSVAPYMQFLDELDKEIVLSAVVGPSDPADSACDAQPATRVRALLTELARFSQLSERTTELSICAPDQSTALELARNLQRFHLAAPCLDGVLADLDADMPGAQPSCAAWITSEGYEATMPHCDTGRIPCYAIESESRICDPNMVRFQPTLGYSITAYAHVECLVE